MVTILPITKDERKSWNEPLSTKEVEMLRVLCVNNMRNVISSESKEEDLRNSRILFMKINKMLNEKLKLCGDK